MSAGWIKKLNESNSKLHKEDVDSMLETVGSSKEEWMDLPFESKFMEYPNENNPKEFKLDNPSNEIDNFGEFTTDINEFYLLYR